MRGPSDGLHEAERLVLEHRLIERHRDVVLGLEADRRGDLLGSRERRQVQRAHDDALIGEAEAHPLAELVLGEHRAQNLGERLDVDDLAVADHPGRQRRGGSAFDGNPVARLHSRHVAGLDVKTDDLLGVRASHG